MITTSTPKSSLQLTRFYPRSLALFGPAEAAVDRCFTGIFEVDEVRYHCADITAHTSDERCSEAAHENS
ncbi:hypothetical protein [Streptomyces canus]|uniref:hypothetical protein n=1 Tax=Streptomyces canus TaxID=58343 RepID=UPI002E2ED7F9|nr:hypothetical protein [Streptomyces canus]